MKHVKLTYGGGKEEAFLTTNANAATMVERFCHGGQLWVERFEYHFDSEAETEWFERRGHRFVPANKIDHIDVDRDGVFDDDRTHTILASD